MLYDKRVKLEGISSKQIRFFSWLVLVFCLILGWLGILLSLLGIFFGVIIKFYFLLAFGASAFFLVKNFHRDFWKSEFFLVIAVSLTAALAFLFWSAPTIFSGRDQGSLSEAAIRLVENNSLPFSSEISNEFFKIYGPGKALNFPGFNYNFEGNLITQFSPGYIAWLASFFSIFGLTGFSLANGLTFFIFLVAFYLVSRQFLTLGPALASLFLILTSFVFPWFLKFTLSENLALALFWFGLFQLLNFLRKEDRFSFIYLLLTWGLFIFSRPEAWAFILIINVLLFFKLRNKKDLQILILDKKNLALILIIGVIFTASVRVNPQAFLELFKGALKPLLFFQKEISGAKAFSLFFYMLKVLKIYFLSGFLIFAAMEIFHLIRKKKTEMLIPFLAGLPAFFYLIQPGITLDHPWMLRRLAFCVIPLLVLYSVFLWNDFLKKRIFFYAVCGLMLAGNIGITAPFLTFIPDENLLRQTADLSQNFAASDLIFVDQKTSGSGWSMMTGPLNFVLGKQAVYLFNPADVAKINLEKFSDVYFIIPDGQLAFYEENGLPGRLNYIKDYQLHNRILTETTVEKSQVSGMRTSLPEIKDITVRGGIYKLKK
ncbi:MAG: hypothetical protein CO140_02855 [Candidatus Moranbacteria bacterium CG_4_9_14_3_um_filter_40_7]|nr:MAG: hypothetical protein COX31_00500 [Candidatus Moranbacteria bacterium CG23_combo_of_CG06-09_8_20_14_all_40_16]PIU80606.1 MAG: hypothetical protein COS71_02525 [Candidatus Moranbacteria bacterium CG06_land_8_20_14_3_00_40_12]PJA87701.1 MAG: hypothetical protein CO140_02855 [Candidatus Moranbacteria bacterium CG_4_9_14_3_um_filter_40_7]